MPRKPPTPEPDATDDHARPMPGAAITFEALLRMLEDGQFHGDLTQEMRRINQTLSQHVIDHGGKAKASLSISLDFVLGGQGEGFTITAGFKTKLPDEPRSKTFAWSTPDGYFTPNNPKQMNLFGVRTATEKAEPTRAV